MSNKVKITSAHTPCWADEEKAAITLTVRLSSVNGEIPFTASPGCNTEYGRELFVRAKFGEFGEIGPYSGPVKEETKRVLFAGRRAKALQVAESRIAQLDRANRLGMATPEELEELGGLEVYSVHLMRAKGPSLPQSPYVL